MLKFDYTDRSLFREAMAAIDQRQPFIIVVKGWKRRRILKGLDAYREFYEYHVRRGTKNLRALLKFSYHVFWALNFWLLCLYKQGADKKIEFQDTEDSLVVQFEFVK